MSEEKPFHHRVAEHCVRIAGTSAKVCLEPIRSRYYKHYHKKRHHLIIDLALSGVVVILGVLIGYLWIAPILFAPVISFKLVNKEPLKSLARGEWQVRLTNTSKDPLTNIKVGLHAPKNVLIEANDSALSLATLPPGASTEVAWQGRILGRLQADGSFASEDIVLTSDYDRKEKHHQELSHLVVRPEGSELMFDLKGPTTVVTGESAEWTLVLKNSSDQTYKASGNWSASSGIKSLGSPTFTASLSPRQNQEVVLRGNSFLSKESSEKITVEAGVREQDEFYPQVREEIGVRVVSSRVAVTMTVTDGRSLVRPGEVLPFSIHYQNNESEVIENLVIETNLSPDYFVLATLSSAEARDNGQHQLRWSVLGRPTLTRLEPGASGDLQFFVQVRKPIVLTSHETVSNLPAEVALSYIQSSRSAEALKVRGILSSLPLETVVNLETAVRYFAFGGEQLGRGPLPPRVGRETRYWVFLKLSNTTSAAQDGLVTMRLASGVRWTGQVSAKEPLEYARDSGVVTWRVGELKAWDGYNTPGPEAAFEIAFTPTASQTGQAPPLVLEQSFTGQGSVTNQPIKILLPPLTTNLTGDSIAVGKGFVKP